jgi:peroxiredoxin
MPKAEINSPAPDFSLPDFRGNLVRLSDFQGNSPVVLVFNRGFF